MDATHLESGEPRQQPSRLSALWPLTAYFLKLGAIGFGGPPALVGYMHRDLVEREQSLDEDTYKLALALAQIMPGPLAAQTAIAIGYFQAGILGATLVGLAFVFPSFLMVIGLSVLYVSYGGLWWMQALFYGIGAAVIAIIAIAAYKLARSTNKRDPLLWGIFAVLAIATVWAQTELAQIFLLAGLVVLLTRAWPGRAKALLTIVVTSLLAGAIWAIDSLFLNASFDGGGDVLMQILLFFTKAGAFVFGSGLAIVPFLNQGVVQQYGWLNEHQFLDAVAVAMVTPGPVVITVAFIGFLVAGLAGAIAAAIGIFVPVYVFTIIPAPWFQRHRENLQLKAFVAGATAAATGAIAGAVVVLGQRALFDVPTVLIALVSLGLLWRFKVTEPVLVTAAGIAGLVLWPIVGRVA
ncbi:MAG TPA: chromate efflux transporter [Chloroflexota bacterium]|jgi:chromate transporter|nr:chromate efflux transporter [Chloroflexota bacterium]